MTFPIDLDVSPAPNHGDMHSYKKGHTLLLKRDAPIDPSGKVAPMQFSSDTNNGPLITLGEGVLVFQSHWFDPPADLRYACGFRFYMPVHETTWSGLADQAWHMDGYKTCCNQNCAGVAEVGKTTPITFEPVS